MASTRTKNLARAIQRANPGMKYTEALRHAEAGRVVVDFTAPYTEAAADMYRTAGMDMTHIACIINDTLPIDPTRVEVEPEKVQALPARSSHIYLPAEMLAAHEEELPPTSAPSASTEERSERSGEGQAQARADAVLTVDEAWTISPESQAEAKATVAAILRAGLRPGDEHRRLP